MNQSSLSRPLAGVLLALSAAAALSAEPAPAASATSASLPATPELIPADVQPPAVALTDAVDFDALRIAYGRRMDYHQRCEASLPTVPWAQATQAKDFAAAYAIAARWLSQCPVVERVHMWAYASAKELQDADKMELHKRWYQGLIGSVLKTGDGLTPETAWSTISVSEEYAVLQYKHLRPGAQALLMHPRPLDRLTAKPVDGGDDVVLYFNPELHFARLNHELGMK